MSGRDERFHTKALFQLSPGPLIFVLFKPLEFTSANTPQLNGVAERGLALIEKVAKASVYQAKVSFVDMGLPPMEKYWAEAHNFSCDNRTATTSNKNMKSPHEVWHGEKSPLTLIQWFQPCFFKVKRKRKKDAQAEPGFYPVSYTHLTLPTKRIV